MSDNPQRKMVKIDVVETSGVDHPAHLTEGWVVMKAADTADVDALFGTATKSKEPVVAEITQEQYDAAVAKAAGLETQLAEAVAKAEKAETEKAEAIAKAAPAESPEEAMLKAVPEAIRVRLEKAEADAAAHREEFAKEVTRRLDAEAVAASKTMFKALSLDHDATAPALRKFAAVDADAAEKITTLLKAADAQLESAGLFAELGKSTDQGPTTAQDEIAKMAKALREADPTLSESAAISKAVDLNPSLFTEYMKGN